MKYISPILFCALLCASVSADPVISEFMASNGGSVLDGDGASSDWIEIYNPDPVDIDLAGWKLKDSSTTAWTFPSVSLQSGGYLVVFASGQATPNYVDAGGHLHTDFKLNAAGETIALLRPDNSVASEFSAPVPKQRNDVSYGIFTETTPLVEADSPARIHVETGATPAAWHTDIGFDDSGWFGSPASAGFNLDAGPVLGTGVIDEVTAYLVPEGTSGNQSYGGALGMDFVVLEPALVTELGVFDSGSDGLSTNLTAQLWQRNDNGTPGTNNDDTGVQVLASETFTPASPGTLVGGSRFKALATPLTLQPGTYTIVGYGYGGAELNGNLGAGTGGDWETDDGDGTLQFTGGSRFGAAGSFPATPDGGPVNRYAAGTFKFIPQGASEILMDVEAAMHGVSDTLLERIVFNIDDASAINSLIFEIGYDDGFIAWINGTEIARRNAPVTAAGNAILSLPVTATLQEGANLLAIEGRNLNAGDSDFILRPALRSVTTNPLAARYFTVPTPGFPNDNSGILGFVEDTQFTVDRGIFEDAFDVEILTATQGASIRYTIDGSTPSPTVGTLYAGPITISTTTVLRAMAYLDNYEPTDVDTQTYLFLDDVATQSNTPSGYPTSWAGVSADYGMDDNPADYARAAGSAAFSQGQAQAAVIDSLKALPSLSIVTDAENLFDPTTGIYVNPSARGQAWERPISLELIHPDGTPGFQENAGIRMMGFSSRNINYRKLHMRLLFKKEYGAGRLNHPFFGDDRADNINTIALRGNLRDSFLANNSGTYIGDEWAKRAQSDMGQPAVRGTFVHLYINGIYWGVYNPTERPDDTFGENYLGGAREDFDVVKFCCPDRVVSGSMTEWNDLLTEARAGLSADADYQRVQGNNPDGAANPAFTPLVDVDNLIDFLINGQYHGSGDWPGNYYAIRDRVEGRTTGYKFFTWDNDLVWNGGNPNGADKVTPSVGHNWWTESPGEVDIGIRQNAEYRLRFADRAYQHYHHDGALTVSANIARWNELASIIRPALFAESARWGDANAALRTVQDNWDPMNTTMLNSYFPNRENVVFGYMRANNLYPSIEPPEFNQHGGVVSPGFALAFTGPPTLYYTLDGSDPRLPGGNISPAAVMASAGTATVPLIGSSTPVRALIPGDASNGTDWLNNGFDDSTWLSGTGGVGYERNSGYQDMIGINVESAMFSENQTAYVRVPFAGVTASDFQSLTLKIHYDDGFIAFLNGVQIAAANAPAAATWSSGAIGAHEANPAVPAVFDVSAFTSDLMPAGNVLAIQGLNLGDESSEFIIQATLEGESITAGSSVTLNESTLVRARALEAGEWSALNEASFIVGTPASSGNLVISEIFYNPPGTTETAEFIELRNISSEPIDLSGVRFTSGITYEFPLGFVLAPGEFVVLNAGTYTGSLANSGENLTLIATDDSVISSFDYGEIFPWPEAADGDGFSLVFISGDPADAANWRSSVAPGGSPGNSDSSVYVSGDLIEYAMGNQAISLTSTPAEWQLSYPRKLAADDVTFSIEISENLVDWTPAGTLQSESAPDADGTAIRTASGDTSSLGTHFYIRVRVRTSSL